MPPDVGRSEVGRPGGGASPTPKVVPDWRGGDKVDRKRLKPGHYTAVKARMQQLWGKKVVKKKAAKGTLKQRRLANKYALAALDRTLKCCLGCTGLVDFRPTTPPKPLQHGERRFFVPIARLPEALRRRAFGRTRRASIEEVGGRTRLEIVWDRRPSLHQVIDMGSIGLYGKQAMLLKGCVRGTLDVDPPHRRHDNAIWALAQGGLTWAKLEMQLSQCFSSAPYGGSAHFRALQGAAEEFFGNPEVSWDFFQAHYPRIAW